ncbi:MAG: phosphopyruvate hydratase [Pseudomonadota bacterium]
MYKITAIHGREILDSRGNPTVEVELNLNNNFNARASVPSGASCGKFEAHELRDGNDRRYRGKGCIKAVNNINDVIRPQLVNQEFDDQAQLDEWLINFDGSDNKTNLGANSILALSIAFARAAAKCQNTELFKYLSPSNNNFTMPRLMINIINGGAHANNALQLQEFMIVPQLDNYHQNLQAGSEIFHQLGKILAADNYSTAVGDEGGYAPDLNSSQHSLTYIMQAINQSGYNDNQVGIAIDAAASEIYNNDGHYLVEKGQVAKDQAELTTYYEQLVSRFPIISIEDGVSEDDISGWQILTNKLGSKIALVGDDLFVTNCSRLQYGIDHNLGNAILIKPNQIGTVSETLAAINLARKHNYKVIISHRSGETEDTFIAHLAVAVNADFIKTGSMSRGERIAKYNELLRLAEVV